MRQSCCRFFLTALLIALTVLGGSESFTSFISSASFTSMRFSMLQNFPQLLAVLLPIVLQLVVFLRWLHRRIRDDEIHRAFVRDVATNHLPHIYEALRAIAEQQGIVLDAPPPVRFMDLNERRREKRWRPL